jgi:hypothetical protein
VRGGFIAIVVATCALAAGGLAFGATVVFGRTLYRHLLANPIRASELPSGFSSAQTSPVDRLGNVATDHHAVGAVAVLIDRGRATFMYVVFPTRSDALGWWEQANSGDPQKGMVRGHLPVGLFPTPSVIASGSWTGTYATGKKFTWRGTQLGFVADSVGVLIGKRDSAATASKKDIWDALALGRLALHHLRTLAGP